VTGGRLQTCVEHFLVCSKTLQGLDLSQPLSMDSHRWQRTRRFNPGVSFTFALGTRLCYISASLRRDNLLPLNMLP